MNTQPGEYLYLHWDDGRQGPYEVVRGHVSPAVAAESVRSETGWPRENDKFRTYHAHARFVPVRPGSYDYDMRFRICGQGRGTFPVTIVEKP